MCLFEKEIKNPKFETNKKNKGNIPKPLSNKLLNINIGCGWCCECRKKIANDWKIRLNEEIKDDKQCYFIGLSFSAENIDELEKIMYKVNYRGLETNNNETDVNLLCSFAVRRWTERWRKQTKKAPKHFLITELGETSSERIHLHGILWTADIKLLEKTWKYGKIDIGEWVDNRTINYITKYITKIDKKHIGYKQAIFVSKGLGKGYIERNKHLHIYKGEETRQYYKQSNGIRLGLPRYYKEKLWNETEREQLYLLNKEKQEIKLNGEIINKNIELEEFNKKLNKVREDNKRAGYGTNLTVNKKYIITEAMKTNYEELKKNKEKYKNIIKCVDKREITGKKKHEGIEITKSNNTEIIYYGNYIGTLTEAQRNYNKLLDEARERQISVKKLRLIKAGIIVDNFVEK